MSSKLTIGFTAIAFRKSFWGFTPDQYQRRSAQMQQTAKRLGAACLASPQAFENAVAGRAAARLMNKTDLAVLDVATYPEGKAALAFFDALKVPLVLWSRAETVHGSHVGHNSFCGANFLAGHLALSGTRFRTLYGELRAVENIARLRTATRLIAAAKAAAGSRIGLIGEGVVPKFYDIDISPKDRAQIERRYRIKFVNVPIQRLVDRAQSYPETAMRRAGTAFAKRFSQVAVDQAALIKQARMLQAIRDLTREGRFASLAIRCWPELQSIYGAWPCPAISALNDLGIPTACEGDPGGALDMLLAAQLTKTPTTLVDIVDWDERRNSLAIWHCGPTACSWADKGARLLPHNVDGRAPNGRPALGLPGIVDLDFKPGKVSVFRTLGALDDEFVLEGQITRAPAQRICGSYGMLSRVKAYGLPVRMAAVREGIFTRALPHHYTAARGHLFS